jgi:uncharacterized protein YjiS (DUF1127 family)
MFGPYRTSAATVSFPASAVSKSRTDFGVVVSNPWTHFWRTANVTWKTPHMPLQAPLAPTRASARSPRRVTAVRCVIGLLRRWRERVPLRPQLCELDDHLLQDIGFTREARLSEAARLFRRQWFSAFL